MEIWWEFFSESNNKRLDIGGASMKEEVPFSHESWATRMRIEVIELNAPNPSYNNPNPNIYNPNPYINPNPNPYNPNAYNPNPNIYNPNPNIYNPNPNPNSYNPDPYNPDPYNPNPYNNPNPNSYNPNPNSYNPNPNSYNPNPNSYNPNPYNPNPNPYNPNPNPYTPNTFNYNTNYLSDNDLVKILSSDFRVRLDIGGQCVNEIDANHESWATRLRIVRIDGASVGPVDLNHVIGIFSEDNRCRLDLGTRSMKVECSPTHESWATRLRIRRLGYGGNANIMYGEIVGIFSESNNKRLDIGGASMKEEVPSNYESRTTILKIVQL